MLAQVTGRDIAAAEQHSHAINVTGNAPDKHGFAVKCSFEANSAEL
jgi:hypothetical protein